MMGSEKTDKQESEAGVPQAIIWAEAPFSDQQWLAALEKILSAEMSALRRADLIDSWLEMYRRRNQAGAGQ